MKNRILKVGFGYSIIIVIMSAICLSPLLALKEFEQPIAKIDVNEQEDEVPLQEAVEEKQEEKKEEVKTTKKSTTKKTTTKTTTTKKSTAKVVKGSKAEYQAYAKSLFSKYGWSEYDFECLVKIVNHESSWNVNAVNKSSGACGLFQALPCSKMSSYGSDYRTNYKTQIKWGLNYIKQRYSSPSKAWSFWQKHHWY